MTSPRHAAPDLAQFGYTQELKRTLSFTDLLFYGLIFMVPIAPMAIFGGVFQASGGMIVLAYIVGVIALSFTAASFSQMTKAFPIAGSVYNFASRAIHPSVGFLAGWAILLDYLLVPSLLYLVAAMAMNGIITVVPVWGWLLLFIAVNTVINLTGIRITARVTKIFIVGELIVLAIFLIIGITAIIGGKGNGWGLEPLFNSETFSWSLIFGATSVAVLSFLGFDGIAMLSEENKESANTVGKSMMAALALAGLLFVAQTWVAALLVENPGKLIAEGDGTGTAFYDAAALAGGQWMFYLCAGATALAWGFADAMVAQVATSRLLYAMGRDGALPRFLAKVSRSYSVPYNAILLGSVLAIVLPGSLLIFLENPGDGVAVVGTLINFGAMIAFMTLHVSVVWHFVIKRRSSDLLLHLVSPIIGFVILGFVVWNANLAAQIVGLIWLGVGFVIMLVLLALKRNVSLVGMD
ncbi:APC family permease [Nonomuraea sp. NPDC050310]|uniref:APC family permease n=1 Tax=Nonomuraea sp. NPDC050310 TaxID=3154935 RepID=UPI0033F2C274